MAKKGDTLDLVALILVIVGGLNWGLVGLLNGFDLVAAIFGPMSVVSRAIYIIVGLAALYVLVTKPCDFAGRHGSGLWRTPGMQSFSN